MKNRHVTLGYTLVFIQFLVALIISGLLYAFTDGVTAYSALAGGMISTMSNAYFAVRLFSDHGSWQPKQLASTVFRGESGKLILTGALFVLVMVLIRPLNVVSLFAAYLVVQVSPLIAANRLLKD